MKRWVCPKCGQGVLAPERLATLDVRRWCLRCSGKASTLIERSVPSKATAAARAAEVRAAATTRRQDRRAAEVAERKDRHAALLAANDRRRTSAATWLRLRIPAVLKLRTWTEARKGRPEVRWPPQIVIRQGGPLRAFSSGHAWWSRGRLVVTTGRSAADDLACLVHEVAHIVDRARSGSHGQTFRALEAEAIGELVGAFVKAETIYYGPRAERTCRIAVQAWLGPPDPALHVGERAEIIAAQGLVDNQRGAYSSIHKPADAWPREVTITDGQIWNATNGHTVIVADQGQLDAATSEGLRLCDLDECELCASDEEPE